jgi:hypothetical protein
MSNEAEPITCRVTFWYQWRRIAMLVLVLGFSAYFFYDWKVGYPAKRDGAAEKKRLVAEKGPTEGAAAYEKLAAEKGWPASPEMDKDWDYAIAEQLVCGILAGAGGLVMLYFYIRTVRGTLTADADSFTTPAGQHVPFASAFRIDRRKWDHKGLAYVYYTDSAGKEQRAVIDDLIFGGAAKVLDRLSANFKGEVIDLAKPEEPAAAPPPEESTAGDAPAEQKEPA